MNNRLILAIALLIWFPVGMLRAEETPAKPNSSKPTTQPSAGEPGMGTETIVFLRHGEKPVDGRGQLTPQGLNRALALPDVLIKKFGKPDYIFAPDPLERVKDRIGLSYYVRPLATIEPTAIKLDMPVQTPFGYRDIAKLNEELGKPQYASAVVFVAWEHVMEQKAVKDILKSFGADNSQVPAWTDRDYDSLFVVKVRRSAGEAPKVTFEHDHENLDGQSKEMPTAATTKTPA